MDKKSLPSRFTKNYYSSQLERTLFVKTSYKISNYLLIDIFQWTNINNLTILISKLAQVGKCLPIALIMLSSNQHQQYRSIDDDKHSPLNENPGSN